MSVAILYLTNTLAPHAMMPPRIVTLLLLVFSAAVQPILCSYLLSTIVPMNSTVICYDAPQAGHLLKIELH